MNQVTRIAVTATLAIALWSVLSAQQAEKQVKQQEQETVNVEQRLDEIEKRLASVESAIQTSVRPAAGASDASSDTRLIRLEGRIDRLESQSLRQPGGSSGNMLESRVRMLEQQIARLRR